MAMPLLFHIVGGSRKKWKDATIIVSGDHDRTVWMWDRAV